MASPVLVASSMAMHIPAPFHAMQQANGRASALASVRQMEEDDAFHTQGPSERSGSRSGSRTPVLLHCPFDGCSRSFAKACKLEDHQRSHTGERPFQCTHPGCEKDFLRKDHLQRHARSHRAAETTTTDSASDAARPFQCHFASSSSETCGRRFLTRQHLERHVREFHDLGSSSCDEGLVAAATATGEDGQPKVRPRKRARRPGAYSCSVGDCAETFTKRKLLRAHVNVFHSDKGRTDLHTLDADEAATVARLPFACTEEDCEKRFPTNAKRAAHVEQRHSQRMRYVCTFAHEEGDAAVVQFATWSELKAHHRTAHKPTCSIAGCGKEFKEARNLRLQMQRSHPDDVGTYDDEEEEDESGTLSFSMGGEPDTLQWLCSWKQDGERCTQTFSSKYNRDVHMRSVHQGERPFACPHSTCTRRFTSKRASVRHAHKCAQADQDGKEDADEDNDNDEDEDDDFFRREGGAVPEAAADRPRARKRVREPSDDPPQLSAMDLLTGKAYAAAEATKKRKVRGRVLACPWSRICALRETATSGDEDDFNGSGSSTNACAFRFSRVYDVQRHLQRQHDLQLSQLDIRALLDDAERAQLGSPRSGTQVASESQQMSTDAESDDDDDDDDAE